jgi:hypothetical protein
LRLTPREIWRAGAGQLALLRARRDVRRRPQGELVHKASAPRVVTHVPEEQLARGRAVALGVSRAARYGLFHPTCLVQSLAITRRLGAERVDGAVVRVGVAKRNGEFVAHAWVELGGEVIGDDASAVERYEPLDELQISHRP